MPYDGQEMAPPRIPVPNRSFLLPTLQRANTDQRFSPSSTAFFHFGETIFSKIAAIGGIELLSLTLPPSPRDGALSRAPCYVGRFSPSVFPSLCLSPPVSGPAASRPPFSSLPFRSVSFQAGLRAQLASIFDSNTLKQYPGPGVESRFNVLPRILSRVRKRLTTSRRGEFRARGGSLRTHFHHPSNDRKVFSYSYPFLFLLLFFLFSRSSLFSLPSAVFPFNFIFIRPFYCPRRPTGTREPRSDLSVGRFY